MTTARTRFSRRAFLASSSLAASAVSSSFTAPHLLRAASTVSANERVGIGYIGAGRRAQQLTGLPADAHIVAIADCDIRRAESMAKKHNCRAHQDYRQLLDDEDVDAVIVSTPDHWHVLPSVHACQAGKDIYIEKPMTLTIREGRQLVQAVRKHQRVLQTGSQQRSMAANRFGCALVRSGAIGRVHTVLAANYPSPWECALPGQPVPEGLDWNAWCGQAAVVPFNNDIRISRSNPGWISFRPWSGGEMAGWGAHGFDQIQWALGKSLTGPVEVWSEGEPFEPPTYREPGSRAAGDKAGSHPTVFMRYADDTVVKLGGGPGGGGVFQGEKGTITIDRARVVSDPPEIVADAQKKADYRPGGDTREHLANWVDCIKSREKPVADVEIGHRSTTVCHLGNIARWTGRRLKWDPEKEIFPDDTDANSLLQREQRKGFEIPDSV